MKPEQKCSGFFVYICPVKSSLTYWNPKQSRSSVGLERNADTVEVAGSSPAVTTIWTNSLTG